MVSFFFYPPPGIHSIHERRLILCFLQVGSTSCIGWPYPPQPLMGGTCLAKARREGEGNSTSTSYLAGTDKLIKWLATNDDAFYRVSLMCIMSSGFWTNYCSPLVVLSSPVPRDTYAYAYSPSAILISPPCLLPVFYDSFGVKRCYRFL